MDALCASTPEHFFSIMKRVKKMCSLGADIVRHDLCAGQGVSPKGIEKDIVVDGMDVVAFFFLVLSPHLGGALCHAKIHSHTSIHKKNAFIYMHSHASCADCCNHIRAMQIAAFTYELCRPVLHPDGENSRDDTNIQMVQDVDYRFMSDQFRRYSNSSFKCK